MAATFLFTQQLFRKFVFTSKRLDWLTLLLFSNFHDKVFAGMKSFQITKMSPCQNDMEHNIKKLSNPYLIDSTLSLHSDLCIFVFFVAVFQQISQRLKVVLKSPVVIVVFPSFTWCEFYYIIYHPVCGLLPFASRSSLLSFNYS